MYHERTHDELRDKDIGLSDLHGDALRVVSVILLSAGLVLLLIVSVVIQRVGHHPVLVGLVLIGLAVGTWFASRYRVRLGSIVLVIGMVALTLWSSILFPHRPIAATLVIPVLLATVLFGTLSGLGTVVGGGGLLIFFTIRDPSGDLVDVIFLTLGLGGLVWSLTTILWRLFYTVLDWSWTSYREAQRLTNELRERQAQLIRLNASLTHAYDQLEQVTAQLERARRAAEEARRLKAEFAASVSHELRTPLNLIIGLSELIVLNPPLNLPKLPEIYRADIEAIYRNACHISNLVDDVLDLSQIEAHRIGLVKEWTSVRDIIAQAVTTVRTLFEKTGLWLEVHLVPDLPPVFVDPVRVRQILINLLNNAVRFTEVGGVRIDARIEAEQLVISVADTGTGIAPEDLPHVFQEFWRPGEPLRGRRGSGLGLAVSRRFAELHGGNLWVTSTPGRGSTFFLAIPLGQKEVVQKAGETLSRWRQTAQPIPETQTVLLVDPQPEHLRLFSRHLDGYHVIVAPDITSVASHVEETAVQAVIVDRRSRAESVRHVLQRRQRGQGPGGPPIITCTFRTAKTRARELGVVDFLVKPVSQQQLQRALRQISRSVRDLVLADDDPEMLHLLSRMISVLAPRCQVRTAMDGLQTLQLLRERPPQGLVLDLIMPNLDGQQLLQCLREDPQLAQTKVVVISGYGAERDALVAEALEIGQVGGLPAEAVLHWIQAGLAANRSPGRTATDPA